MEPRGKKNQSEHEPDWVKDIDVVEFDESLIQILYVNFMTYIITSFCNLYNNLYNALYNNLLLNNQYILT